MNERYGAIVIYPSERIKGFGNILAIARAEAKTILKTNDNVAIKDVLYSPVLKVWIALFALHGSRLQKHNVTQGSCHKEGRAKNE